MLNELRRQIVTNELPPGTALTELGLAGSVASSQGLIREALLRLEGDGLVTRSGHGGTAVTELESHEAAEILGLRTRIETRAAGSVCKRVKDSDLTDLAEQLDAMRGAARSADLWALIQADTDFHLGLFRISGLHAMEPILARCILHTHRFRAWAPWHQRPFTVTAERHVPILDAVTARDGVALRRELETHLATIVDARSP